MNKKLILIILLSVPANSVASVVIMIPHTYSLIQFLKGLSITWSSSKVMKAAPIVADWIKGPITDCTKNNTVLIPGSLVKKAVTRAIVENPEKAATLGSGIIAAGKSIIEGKIASTAIEKTIEVAGKAKETVQSKINESNKESGDKETIETTQVGL